MQLGTPPVNLERSLYTYLFQMTRQLNVTLNALEQETTAVQETAGRAKSEADARRDYQTLKALVIKTADLVRSEMDRLSASLSGTYVAQSDFGSYVEQLNSQLEADPSAVTQYYSFVSDLKANTDAVDAAFQRYKVETGGYIKTGVVCYDGETPVYGVAVGQNLKSTEVDGQTVIEQTAFRSTFTANRLSFWQDDTEVAYVSNNRLYITNITVLSGLTIGSWEVSTGAGFAIQWVG